MDGQRNGLAAPEHLCCHDSGTVVNVWVFPPTDLIFTALSIEAIGVKAEGSEGRRGG